MARDLWTGEISFGLLNIPVGIKSSKEEDRISFKMLDKKNFSPIGYKQYNKETGREVKRTDIVKGYEYEKNEFVVVTEEEMIEANPKATKTIDIEDFVDLEEVDVLFFEKPYYLVPGKNGEKGYVLLRKVLEETKKVAIAKIVMHNRQHLVCIMAKGDYLILEMLRFAHEVLDTEEADFLDEAKLKKVKITPKEISMAKKLLEGMTTKWNPSQYKDTYQDDLKAMIKRKVKSGKTKTVLPVEKSPTEKVGKSNVIDMMELLQKSLATKDKGHKEKTSKRHHA